MSRCFVHFTSYFDPEIYVPVDSITTTTREEKVEKEGHDRVKRKVTKVFIIKNDQEVHWYTESTPNEIFTTARSVS